MALPARAPSAVGPRHLVGAAADRRDDRRTPAQAGRAADQAGLAVRVRSHHRPADLADAGNAGAAVGRARREDVADAADSDQAAAVLAHARHDGRSDRLHAGAAAPALENLKRYRWEPTPFIPPVLAGGQLAGIDQHRQHRRRHQLAGRGVRSRNGDLLRPGEQLVGHDAGFTQAYFEQIKPENQAKNRIPMWEAEPVERGHGEGGGAAGAARRARRARGARAAAQPRAAPPARPRCTGARRRSGGGCGGRGGLTQGLEGLPIVKPPYGVLAAIDSTPAR